MMREDSIERILNAAKELFATNGFAETTMQMIAKKAGLVPSGIYHYFAGEADLVEAVLNREKAAIEKALGIGLQQHLLEKGPDAFLDYMMEAVCENKSQISLICQLIQFHCLPEYCLGKMKILRSFSEMIEEYIPQDGYRELLEEIVVDFTTSAVFYSVTDNRSVFKRQINELKKKAKRLPCFSDLDFDEEGKASV